MVMVMYHLESISEHIHWTNFSNCNKVRKLKYVHITDAISTYQLTSNTNIWKTILCITLYASTTLGQYLTHSSFAPLSQISHIVPSYVSDFFHIYQTQWTFLRGCDQL